MNFNINMAMEKKILIIRLEGEIDHHTSEIAREKIDKELDKGIVNNLLFNLEKVSFMDSSGLGMLLGRYKKIRQMDGNVSICCVNPTIYKIFELSGIFKILAVYETEDESKKSMGKVI